MTGSTLTSTAGPGVQWERSGKLPELEGGPSLLKWKTVVQKAGDGGHARVGRGRGNDRDIHRKVGKIFGKKIGGCDDSQREGKREGGRGMVKKGGRVGQLCLLKHNNLKGPR